MNVFQFLPLALFSTYAVWHGTPTPDRWVVAFQLGAVAALIQLVLVMRRPHPPNRLILGANFYLLVGGLAAFTQQWWVLRAYGLLMESGIFLFMLAVGAVATVATPTGFVTATDAPAPRVRTASLVMLAATGAALVASIVFRGDMRWSAWGPVTVLALVERALAQRLREVERATSPPSQTTRVAVVIAAAILLGASSPHGAASQSADPVAQARAAPDADNTLNPSVLFVVNANRADYRLSPRLEYVVTGSVTIAAGVDLFAGGTHTLYGQFNDRDRVWLTTTWRF